MYSPLKELSYIGIMLASFAKYLDCCKTSGTYVLPHDLVRWLLSGTGLLFFPGEGTCGGARFLFDFGSNEWSFVKEIRKGLTGKPAYVTGVGCRHFSIDMAEVAVGFDRPVTNLDI